MKTETRIIAEQIQAITKESLITIDLMANSYANMGLVGIDSKLEALKYMLSLAKNI